MELLDVHESCSKKRSITVDARRISRPIFDSQFPSPGKSMAMHFSWYSSAVFGGTRFVVCERWRAAVAKHA
jgi:hypothetical protein